MFEKKKGIEKSFGGDGRKDGHLPHFGAPFFSQWEFDCSIISKHPSNASLAPLVTDVVHSTRQTLLRCVFFFSLSLLSFSSLVDCNHQAVPSQSENIGRLIISLQVWFQNRRAKWRRQEKMEASQQLRKFQQEFSSMIPAAAAAAAAAATTPRFNNNNNGGSAAAAGLPVHLDHWLSLTSGAAMAYHQAAAAAAAAAASSAYPTAASYLMTPLMGSTPLMNQAQHHRHATPSPPSSGSLMASRDSPDALTTPTSRFRRGDAKPL